MGISTGYALVTQDLLVPECGVIKPMADDPHPLIARLKKQYNPRLVLVEYPILTYTHSAYVNQLLQIVSEFKELLKTFKVREVRPTEWKQTPAGHYPISLPGISIHAKDAIHIGIWYYKYCKNS